MPLPESKADLPQLCFGRVGHRRLRPVLNAFSYRAYYLRLPLRAMAAGGFDSRLFSRNKFNLLAFYDADYGDGATPLAEWIDRLLREHGIHDADGEVWLQTMPRVLGHVFNPVSFWFCHRANGMLRAVLCDVHNTFGERHCYLLDDGFDIDDGALLHARKVFHVSPFNAVAGDYQFRFSRVLRADASGMAEHTSASIDYGDDAGPILQTSIAGRSRVLDARSVRTAFFSYPLQSFGVVFRIHYQALRLFLKRLPFYSKPAAPQQKVTR